MTERLKVRNDVEHLGRRLAERAEGREHFIASAFAVWRRNNTIPLEDILKCGPDTLWRLAVTPTPHSGAAFLDRATQIAKVFGIDADGLIQVLRFAAAVGAMRGGFAEEGVLKAALDHEDDES